LQKNKFHKKPQIAKWVRNGVSSSHEAVFTA